MLSLCAPKERQKSTMAAKKHIIQIPTGLNGNSATNTRRRFLKEEKQNEKKKDFTDLESSPRVSRQNKFKSASISAYPLELTKQQREDIVLYSVVTSSFSQTKGFFCFSFHNRSQKEAAWKTESALHTLFLDNEKRPCETNFRAMFLR